MGHIDAIVLGASGQVGEHVFRCLSDRGYTSIGTFHGHPNKELIAIDILNRDSLRMLVNDIRPKWVFLPASLTNVDYCEQNPDLSYQVNVIGVVNVVNAIRDIDAKLVYFSSDYIYDGIEGPYLEISPANPINTYGQHKLIAESYISLHLRDYLIVRTTVVYGWESQGKNFIYRLLSNLRAGNSISAPIDQIGSPSYAPDVAHATVLLTELGVRGVVNVAGRTRISRYDFAVAAAHTFGISSNGILPVTTKALGQSALRPLKAGFIVDKAEVILKRELVDYARGLKLMAETEPTTK